MAFGRGNAYQLAGTHSAAPDAGGVRGGVREHHGAVPGSGAVAQVEIAGAGEELGEGLPHRARRAGRGVVPALGELAA